MYTPAQARWRQLCAFSGSFHLGFARKLAVIVMALLASAAVAVPPQYHVTVIPTAGESTAAGINNKGQVAVNSGGKAYLYTPGAGIIGLGGLDATGGATAYGLNDHGQVVGRSQSLFEHGVSYFHAFVYTPGQGMTDIQGPGYHRDEARDINNLGLVTGYNFSSLSFHPNGYIYNANTQQLVDLRPVLGVSDFTEVQIAGINDLNEPTGRLFGGAVIMMPWVHPISGAILTYEELVLPRVTPNGHVIPGSFLSMGQDINDRGVVVGHFESVAGTVGGIFLGGGALVGISGLSGAIYTTADSINNADQIVGNSAFASGLSHGFLYQNSVIYDLNDMIDPALGITTIQSASRPDAINEWGQIAAHGFVPGLGNRAMILSPSIPLASGIHLDVPGKAIRFTKFVGGMDYDAFTPTTNPLAGGLGTTVQLLDGTAGANRDVQIGFDATGSFGGLASDVVTVTGTANDTFVLQISYNESLAIAVFGSEANAYLSWLDPLDNIWKNAVLGNVGGVPVHVAGAYNPSLHFVLGHYGVDTANNHVWAVLNHNSAFAVALPEPATAALLLGGLAATLSGRGRRKRSG